MSRFVAALLAAAVVLPAAVAAPVPKDKRENPLVSALVGVWWAVAEDEDRGMSEGLSVELYGDGRLETTEFRNFGGCGGTITFSGTYTVAGKSIRIESAVKNKPAIWGGQIGFVTDGDTLLTGVTGEEKRIVLRYLKPHPDAETRKKK